MFSAQGLENAVKILDYETELRNMSKEPKADKKYSTGSSVYADQSIVNPNTQEIVYCIASILQSEIFEHFECGEIAGNLYIDLNILTDLPPHLGGLAESVDPQVLRSETEGDGELLEQLLRCTVPTADTIYRYISWIYQSAKYSAQCNIIAFVYIKRIITSHRILHMRNWRGLWLGAIIIAQKFTDDKCLRTGSFASILPGVTKKQLKAAEWSVYQLLDYTGHVKPSVFAKFYFELRSIFLAITHQPACSSKAADGRIVRPLRRAEALRLYDASGEPFGASPHGIQTPTTCNIAHRQLRPQPAEAPSSSYAANTDCGNAEPHTNVVSVYAGAQCVLCADGRSTAKEKRNDFSHANAPAVCKTSSTQHQLCDCEPGLKHPLSREKDTNARMQLLTESTFLRFNDGVRAFTLEDISGAHAAKSIFVLN